MLLAAPATAQEFAAPSEVRVTDEYSLRTWSAESGLPSDVVAGTRQDADGHIVIVARTGVAGVAAITRVDGRRFATPRFEIPDGYATSVVLDAQDNLWLA